MVLKYNKSKTNLNMCHLKVYEDQPILYINCKGPSMCNLNKFSSIFCDESVNILKEYTYIVSCNS